MRLALMFALGAALALGGCAAPPPSKQQANQPAQGASSSALERAKIHTELGVGYYEAGKLAVALEELNEAISADKTYAPAWNARALVHMDLREDSQAESDFKQALKLDPAGSATKNNYGLFLCQRNRGKEGVSYLLDAVKNPLYATPDVAYKNAGLCALNIGDKKSAEEFFQRALKLNPNQPQALYNMALLEYGRDRYAAAKQYFERYAKTASALGPEALLLGARIERRIGDRNAMLAYGNQLRLRYPSAPETKVFLDGRF